MSKNKPSEYNVSGFLFCCPRFTNALLNWVSDSSRIYRMHYFKWTVPAWSFRLWGLCVSDGWKDPKKGHKEERDFSVSVLKNSHFYTLKIEIVTGSKENRFQNLEPEIFILSSPTLLKLPFIIQLLDSVNLSNVLIKCVCVCMLNSWQGCKQQTSPNSYSLIPIQLRLSPLSHIFIYLPLLSVP